MISFLKDRLKAYVYGEDTINLDYKTANLPDNLSKDDINFLNTRGNVRLCNQNVLTPREEEERINEVLAFNFGK